VDLARIDGEIEIPQCYLANEGLAYSADGQAVFLFSCGHWSGRQASR
jgi:hypothetical protein